MWDTAHTSVNLIYFIGRIKSIEKSNTIRKQKHVSAKIKLDLFHIRYSKGVHVLAGRQNDTPYTSNFMGRCLRTTLTFSGRNLVRCLFGMEVMNMPTLQRCRSSPAPACSAYRWHRHPLPFDPYTHGYYKVNGRVGEAFKDGLKLK